MKLTHTALVIPLTLLICTNTAFQKKAMSSINNNQVLIEIPSGTVNFAKQSKDIDLENASRPTQFFIADQISYYDGIWNTTEGRMTLEQLGPDVSGTYNKRGGALYKTKLSRNVLTGYWVQNYSDRRCSGSVNGSYYWGKFRFVFGSKSFTGLYSYCNGSSSYRWDGSRTQP